MAASLHFCPLKHVVINRYCHLSTITIAIRKAFDVLICVKQLHFGREIEISYLSIDAVLCGKHRPLCPV